MATSKILIVDDESFNVDYLEQELDELDYDTVSASNGQEALEKVASDLPDLILLDIMMPVMDGFEVLTRLKSEAGTRDIPVIIISADSDLNSVVQGIALGAEDYLPKPFEPALLKARISSSLEKKRLNDLQQLYLKSMERELAIGREIQQEFLPAELPKLNGWEIAAYFKAAREVAGDFYDVFPLPDRHLLFVIGDVCDKGVGAALFMTLFRSLIRAAATSDFSFNSKEMGALTPSERLNHIISFTNNYIVETHANANMFATIFIGIFNLQSGTLTYMNCGHEPSLCVMEKGSVIPLPRTGPAVGVFPDAKFSAQEIAFEINETVLAYTDGIPDTFNDDKIPFGRERLLKIVESNNTHPELMLQQIGDELHQFSGDASQFDDITLLAIKRKE
jgi:phosphoserine phosphatase RsbU/P